MLLSPITNPIYPTLYNPFIKKPTSILEADCPLEKLPDWELIYSADGTQSTFCWDDFGNTIVSMLHDPVAGNGHFLAFKEIHREAATFLAILNAVVSGSENFVIPFTKWIDENNLVGARHNNDEVQIVQRKDGVWSTLATASGLGAGLWKVVITDTAIAVYDDWTDSANEIVMVEHSISGEGYFGIHGHKWIYDGTHLLRDYQVYPMNQAQIPCMTGYTSPYGVVTASSEWSSTYAAWKGFSCTRVNGTDAWVPVAGDQPAWIQWFFDAAQPMIPIKLELAPRSSMTVDWYNANNPQGITLFGVNRDGSIEQLWTKQDLGDWPSNAIRNWAISGITKGYYGIRFQIDKTNSSESGGTFSTGIGWIKVYGMAPSTPPNYQLIVNIVED